MQDDAMELMPPPAVPALLGSGSDSGNDDGVYGGRVRRRRRRRASSSGYGSGDGRGATESRQPRLPRGDDGARWPYSADVDNGTRWPPSGGHDDHRRGPAAKRSHAADGEQPPAAKRARAADDDGEQPPAMRFLFAADELPRLRDALDAVASGWTGPAGGVCASVLPTHQGGDLVLTVRAVNEDALSPYQVNFMLGGYDAKEKKSYLYFIDYLGAQVDVPYGAHGYGGMMSISVMDRYYEPDANYQEAYDLLKKCVFEVQKLCIINMPKFKVKMSYSGGILELPTITKDNIDQNVIVNVKE